MKVLIVGIFFLIATACLYEKSRITPAEACGMVSFSKDIRPLINSRCATSGCHVAGFQQGDFTSFAGIRDKVDHGSFRLRVIETKSMPPLNPLSDTDFLKIKCWLDMGAQNN